jgi:hypothetical protein
MAIQEIKFHGAVIDYSLWHKQKRNKLDIEFRVDGDDSGALIKFLDACADRADYHMAPAKEGYFTLRWQEDKESGYADGMRARLDEEQKTPHPSPAEWEKAYGKSG